MLIHACVAVSSFEAARFIFEELFSMERLYDFIIEPKVVNTLFGIEAKAKAIVYDAGSAKLEIFVVEGDLPKTPVFNHLCLGFSNRNEIIEKAGAEGFEVRRYERGDSEVVFIVDTDGNLYELKDI